MGGGSIFACQTVGFMQDLHIGKAIRKVLDERQMSVVSFAERLSCSRVNAYRIFANRTIDSGQLLKISRILDHDFFKDYSDLLCR